MVRTVEEHVWLYARMHPGISRKELDKFRRDIEGYEADRPGKGQVPKVLNEVKWLRDLMRPPIPDDYMTTGIIPALPEGRR